MARSPIITAPRSPTMSPSSTRISFFRSLSAVVIDVPLLLLLLWLLLLLGLLEGAL